MPRLNTPTAESVTKPPTAEPVAKPRLRIRTVPTWTFSKCEHPASLPDAALDRFDGLPVACLCTCLACWAEDNRCVCTRCDHSGH